MEIFSGPGWRKHAGAKMDHGSVSIAGVGAHETPLGWVPRTGILIWPSWRILQRAISSGFCGNDQSRRLAPRDIAPRTNCS